MLGEEEARLNRVNYPSEVTIGRSRRDDAEVDGLLDELLNDGDDDVDNDTLTNSCDDRTELSNQSEIKSNQGMMEMLQANSKDFLGGILSFHPSSRANLTNPANEKTLTSTDKSPSKHVTYAEDVKVLESSSDDTSKTDSDRSSVRLEEDEEAIEIVSEDGQSAPEVEFVEDEEQVDGDYEDEGDEEDEEEEEEEEDDYEDDGESVESSDSNTTQDLLERAHDRLNMQGLYEEVTQLRKIVERKDQEIEELSGQLRRAVATKCDLVIAHTELERHHEFNLKQLEEASKQLLKANFGLVEEQASTDVVSAIHAQRDSKQIWRITLMPLSLTIFFVPFLCFISYF